MMVVSISPRYATARAWRRHRGRSGDPPCRNHDSDAGQHAMQNIITALIRRVPSTLAELRKHRSTLKRRAGDVLAYYHHPRTSNDPTQPTNRRLEHPATPPSTSATSPTTSPTACSKLADSDPNYTPD